jgi:hypothetical protein
MPTPVVYPSAKQFIGLAKEVTQGTAVTPITATVPVMQFTPSPKWQWLDDMTFRGSMSGLAGEVQGVGWEEWAIADSPAFFDTLPYFLNNILGDVTDSGATPFVHAFSTLNSGVGQPGSLTLVDWQGPASATNFARVYPGACVSELTLKGNAESSLVMWSAKGLAWPSSVIGSPPTAATSADTPFGAWRTLVGLAGPASGGSQVKTVGEWEITLTRELKAKFTLQGVQTPFIIYRGELNAAGKLNFTVPADEASSVTYLTSNTQPQLQLTVDNGLTLANNRNLQIDCQLAAYQTADINRGSEAVGFDTTFKAVMNSTNAGTSGGLSPVKITVKNNTAAGTY